MRKIEQKILKLFVWLNVAALLYAVDAIIHIPGNTKKYFANNKSKYSDIKDIITKCPHKILKVNPQPVIFSGLKLNQFPLLLISSIESKVDGLLSLFSIQEEHTSNSS